MSSPIRARTILSLVISFLLVGALAAGSPSAAFAQDCTGLPPIDGRNLPTKFAGAAGVLQDNPTGFGDVTPPNPQDSEGNELDQIFLANDDTTLYIGITGNTERDDSFQNTVLVFIDTGDNGGTATLSTASSSTCCALHTAGGCDDAICQACVCALDPTCCDVPPDDWSQACVDLAFGACLGDCPCAAADTSSALRGIDGVTLDFAPEYALAVWNDAGVQTGLLIDLRLPPDTPGTVLTEGTEFAVDNSNLVGVNAEPANDPLQQESNATTATTGFEFAIPLASLGITSTDTINIQALLVSGAGFISNQSLPPLNETVGINGGGVNCVGYHDPSANPPNIVDFSDDVRYPGLQNLAYTLTSPGAAPGGLLDGVDIPTDYGTPAAATQNNYTCFGDAAPYSPFATNGSELDEIFVTSDTDKLYIGITGNIPSEAGNQNTIIVFIDDESGMTFETLFTGTLTGGSGALQGMDGVTMDTGFSPRWAILYWRGGNRHNAIVEDLAFDVDIPLLFSIDTAVHLDPGVNAYSVSLSNFDGVNDVRGDDPIRQEGFAQTAVDGVQFSIRLADLGLSAFSPIQVSACIVSATGFISNQFLPPLNPTNPVPQTDSAMFSDAPLPLAIPDNDGTSAEDTRAVTMALINRVTDINVTVNITHPDISELSVALRHEDTGRSVVLLAQGTGSGANLNITYDSEGAPGVQPAESLLTFNDVDPNGNWTLIVTDTVTGQTGTLDSWGIDVTEYTGGAINCLGQHDAVENPIDMNNFTGNQFLDINLMAAGAPTSFTGRNIPTSVLPQVALATQNNYTCFGDAVEAPPANPPGSEMDQMFVTNTNDRLKLAITGNLQNNGNAYILLLDTEAGGVNPISGITSPPEPLGGGGGEPGLNGMTLDTGFNPDYGLVVHRSDPSAPGDDFSVFLTDLRTNFTRAIGRLIRNSGSGQLLDAVPNGNGSELDQMFIQNDANNLYIGLTGNLENNGNTYLVFLDTWASGTINMLDTDYPGYSGEVRAVAGDVLDVGFTPDYVIMLNRSNDVYFAQIEDLTDTAAPVVTPLTFDTVIAPNTYVGNNMNSAGVNSNPADDAQDVNPANGVMDQIDNATTATTGVQFAIDRASIGSPADLDTIQVAAVLVSGTGYWRNQTLPGLGGQVANLTNIGVDLSGVPGSQFAQYVLADAGGYAVPATFDGMAIPTAMGTALATQDNYTGFGDSAAPPNAGNPNCVQVAFDDSNVLGVTATDANDPGSAGTGMEYDIPFDDLGLVHADLGGDGVQIQIMAVLTGPRGYLSNQFLPPLGTGTAGNLGDASAVDLGTYPGNQFLTYTITQYCGSDPADIDGDGDVDINDVDAFVGVLIGTNTSTCPVQKSDVNGDTLIDGEDIQAFVDAAVP